MTKIGLTTRRKKVFVLLLMVLAISSLCISTPSTSSAFEFGGFADIGLNDSTAEGSRSHFTLGRLDLYGMKRHEKITAFTEFLLEFNDTGTTAIDLERLWVQYSFSQYLKVAGGRFHAALGHWNRSYHHGAHLYNTIDRPEFLNFEDDSGILPSHNIGLLVDGKFRTDPLTLRYTGMIGNGSAINSFKLDPNNVNDNNDNKSYSFRLTMSPSAIEGFQTGFGGVFSTISSDDGTANQVSQNIWEVDLTYITGPFEILAEYYNITDRRGTNYFNNLYYIQAAYTIKNDYIPYYRFENQEIKEDDPYIAAFNAENPLNPVVVDYHKNIVGLRYLISLVSSVKAEVRFVNKRGSLSHTEYAAQWTYTF